MSPEGFPADFRLNHAGGGIFCREQWNTTCSTSNAMERTQARHSVSDGRNGEHDAVQLSVIVPVLNGGRDLAACLDALEASTFRSFEILVVDDGCTDTTEALVRCRGAVYLRTIGHCGPAAARNLGVRHARGEILVFVDSDVVLPGGALKRIAQHFRRAPKLAGVFGSYDDSPFALNFVSQYKNLLHHHVHQNSATQSTTFWTGCGAIRADVFRAVGGFDEKLYPRPTIEDIELGARLHQHGFHVILDKHLQVKHRKHWTFRSMVASDIFDRAIPWSRLILARGPMPRDLNLTYSARFSGACALTIGMAGASLFPAGLLGAHRFLIVLAAISVAALAGLIKLNSSLYLFFARKNDVGFAAKAVVLHWLYFVYSSAVWCGCWTWYRLIRRYHARESMEPAGLGRLPSSVAISEPVSKAAVSAARAASV